MPETPRAMLNQFFKAVQATDRLSQQDKDGLIREVKRAEKEERPPTLVIIGQAGVGKTTTINALFNAGEKVGHASATTRVAQGIDIYFDHVTGSQGDLVVYDMPGLGDGMATYRGYLDLYVETILKADAVLWVHPAADRAVEYMQRSLLDLFQKLPKDYRSRIMFGLNKADDMHPGNWNPLANQPSEEQRFHLQDRVEEFNKSMSVLFSRWSPQTVVYSAKQYYNLPKLFLTLMMAVPAKRRWVLESRRDLADFLTKADQGMVAQARALAGQGRLAPADDQPAQGRKQNPRPTFVEYLDTLSPADYAKLVSDKGLFLRTMQEWERLS